MRCLILTDIHGNLPALTAVLATPDAARCDRIFSLGDHTGFGPQPRQVQQLLTNLDAVMLQGNHEARLHSLDDPRYQGRNWALLHWMGRQLQGMPPDFPAEYILGPVMMTHAIPGNVDKCIPAEDTLALLDGLPAHITHFFSGHNHQSWHVTHNGRTAVNPGSLGMLEDGTGGLAPFAVADINGDDVTVTRHIVPYSLDKLLDAYLASGATDAAPIYTRLAYHTCRTGEAAYVLRFTRFAMGIAKELGIPFTNPRVMDIADSRWPWAEPLPSAAYWKEQAR